MNPDGWIQGVTDEKCVARPRHSLYDLLLSQCNTIPLLWNGTPQCGMLPASLSFCMLSLIFLRTLWVGTVVCVCRSWIMLYGLDVGVEKGLIIVGDSKGRLYFVDARSDEKIFQGQLHKKGMKVGISTGRRVDSLLASAGSRACFQAGSLLPCMGVASRLPHILTPWDRMRQQWGTAVGDSHRMQALSKVLWSEIGRLCAGHIMPCQPSRQQHADDQQQ